MNHHHHHHYYSYADPKQQLPHICTSTIPSSNNTSPAVMGLPNFSTPFIGPSSSFPSYPSSVPSCFPANVPPLFSPTSDDLSDGALIGAFAARDLQIPNGRQALGDNSSQDGGRIGRYSAEERKERIERYRSKRNQRNFQKKITYACRKTLADSRPRVKGRFARNGEIETETAESSADCDAYSYYSNESSWKLEGGDLVKEEDACRYEEEDDDEMWASFLNGISMNLPS